MSTAGWLPAPVEELFGAEAVAEESYEILTVDVPPTAWLTALETARTTLTCTYFDWLSAVDEPGAGFRVSAHVVALNPVRRLLVRTTVPHSAPVLPTAVGVYAGAAWHERETYEMFGVTFEGHPGLEHLLLPENFEGHPLRKDFVLAARVAKAWPGAKEPGESEHGGPKRRQMLPPGVPDPNEWGPLKGQLPAAPARPARAAGDRPVRRTRTAAEGSAGQPSATEAAAPVRPRRTRSASEGSASQTAEESAAGAPVRPRRTRSASEGSASQVAGEPKEPGAEDGAAGAEPGAAAGGAARPRRTRGAGEGSVSQAQESGTAPAEGETARTEAEGPAASGPASAPARPRRARSASGGSASQRAPEPPASATESSAAPASSGDADRPAGRTAPRSSDAPWHHARPAFDEPGRSAETEHAEAEPGKGDARGAVRPHEPAGPQAADPAEPRPAPEPPRPAEPPKPTEPPGPAESPEPTESSEPSEPSEPVESVEPATPSNPADSQSAPGQPSADPESPPTDPLPDPPGGPR
ncbi:NADH-quinone oxidoreductase subunit C [Streptomyces griseofuscus]|uniref:NADH-quinone oxidoreductase subunit C n=1 Tax=Streptomyces griseofuscus TaxID=146922 RepID=UPI00340B6F11